jgi:serine/threonine-protein kinase HipA
VPDRQMVDVWADWHGLSGATRVGALHGTAARGKQVFSFEYDRSWLDSEHALSLDPSLRLVRGPQYPDASRDNFGVFLDSAPDRWGRVLMQRREAQLAREARRPPRTLAELDYLLGVYDGHRMGGLRYRIADGPFLDDNTELASPPWTSLRELEQASLKLERPGAERDPSYAKWLRVLIAPGRSLGGTRPKASVVDQRRRLWIAKFPSARDTDDVGAWEGVLYALAHHAGVATAESAIQRFGSPYHTFLARRFDRGDDLSRIHFASAMTLLERTDRDPASYLELVDFITRHGAHAKRDLEQLWRRIVFFMCVSNVDDHLRNHGFLLEAKGWSLAPAYDLNPVATGGGLTLNVSETDNAQDLELAREVAQLFRLRAKQASDIIAEVVAAVRRWRAAAKKVGVSRDEQDRMADAFELAERATA